MAFTLHRTVWIPLPDGTRLAATIWQPDGAGPFPAVLEYLPYRRRDQTAWRDETTYPAYAAAGIAGVRVDSRGQGDSEGLFDDEYSPQELADASAVIAWIAAQPWSNGKVGMMGISWGGFNALQVAALRPPGLAAVISIASTADRYADDIHYKGGCLLSANVSWAGTMLSYLSRPPDPEVVGNGWAEIWAERLAQMPMLLEIWLRHQRRDDYWRHGSICEDWGAIEVPVWVIAGYGDGYRNCPATLARHLSGAPVVKATTGPWVHKYPHFALPEPQLDFIARSTDWWRQFLAGEPRGVEGWPGHTAYRIERARPGIWRGRDEGAWIGVPRDWQGQERALMLGDGGRLGAEATLPATIATPQHCGIMGGEYFASTPNAEMPADQRIDDALAVCWETEPLAAPLDLFGRPRLACAVAIDRPQGNLIVRLVDLHPDGTAALITRGVLNLCHRGGHAAPEPMVPGAAVPVSVVLDECCYRLRPGHRLRLGLSTAYWPYLVPSPAPVVATLSAGAVLHLPLGPDGAEIELPEPAADTVPAPYPQITPAAATRSVEHDLASGRVHYRFAKDTGLVDILATGLEARDSHAEIWSIDPDDPAGASAHLTMSAERRRGAWAATTVSDIAFRAEAERFVVDANQVAYDGERELHRKAWSFRVPRDHV